MPRAHLLCLVAVLVVGVVYGQSDGFNLEVIDIVPCQETSQGLDVSLYESDILAVQANLTLCHDTSWNINQYNVSAYNPAYYDSYLKLSQWHHTKIMQSFVLYSIIESIIIYLVTMN